MLWALLGMTMLTMGAFPGSQRPALPEVPWPAPAPVPSPGKPKKTQLPAPDDAVHLALDDLLTQVPPCDRCFTRYLFVPAGESLSAKTSSLALNYVSRATGLALPLPVANGVLLRVDLRWYAPRDQDLREWLAIWEEFAFDPSFALLLTKDTLEFTHQQADQFPVVERITTELVDTGKTRQIHHTGGVFTHPQSGKRHDLAPGDYDITEYEVREKRTQTQNTTAQDKTKRITVDVVRLNSRGIDPVAFCQLQEETHSLAPVVEHRYFKYRALNTIKDDGVFKTVFGGLYYDLKGIKRAKNVKGKEKATDLDLFFENIGIGNIKGGENAEQLFDRLRSDQRAVLLKSQVTGKPREVSMFQTPNGREGSGWGAITGDIKDKRVDIGDRAYANLLTPRRDAREAIFPQPNGLLLFALFNGDGALQDEVPPDIANDTTVPDPYPKRLQIFGCITCHSLKGKDGWQPLENQVKKLISRRLDIFDDRGVRGRIASDTIDRLAGLFTGDFSKNLRRAQDDLAEYTLRATGPWPSSVGDQTDVCKLAAQRLHDEHDGFWWQLVDAQSALAELGVVCADKKAAVKLLQQLLPPDRDAFAYGVLLEDPRLGAILEGLAVPRSDWALSYSFAYARVQKNPLYLKLRQAR
jgi:hypothetical protein